jgi:arsenate reductase (glutaredoxin)
MKIYHNPRCSKSRQTLQIIKDAGAEVEIIEYLNEVPTQDELAAILIKLDMNAEDILRKGEDIFKQNYKGKTFSNDEWIKIMIENPKLIERPIIVKGNKAVLGRPPENVNEFL